MSRGREVKGRKKSEGGGGGEEEGREEAIMEWLYCKEFRFSYRYSFFILDFILHQSCGVTGEIEDGQKAVGDRKHHKYRQHRACGMKKIC